MPSIPLPVHSYNLPSRVPARVLNMYAQQTPGKAPVEILSAPGVASFAALGGPGRGLFVMRGSLYAVGGTSLYRVNIDGSADNLGTVGGSEILTFAGNGTELVTSNKYRFDGSAVAVIADADAPQFEVVDYSDGRILYVESGTGRFGGSALNDAGSYSALDYATAEGSPDDLMTLIVDHRQVILFGQESTEIWWNDGGSGFPYSRLAGGFLELGCLATLGRCKQDNSVYWLASDRTIRRLSGSTPVRVSQHGVEEKLAAYATVSDCVAFPYTWGGHLFVVFRFPAAGACWALDVTTGEWHERATYGETDWLVSGAASCYGRVFVQHATTGAVGYLDNATHTEWGGILRRELVYPQVYGANRRIFHGSLELVVRSGDAAIGTTPYVSADISNDGGNTWTALPARELGRVGQYAQRIRWHGLGSSRDRVYRMSCADAVPFTVLDTVLETA